MIESPALSKPGKPLIEIDEPPTSMNGDSLWHEVNVFWKLVKKFKWWFILVFLFIASIAYWEFSSNATYKAKAKFIITDWSQGYPTTPGNSLYTQDRVNQMLMLFLSDSIIQFVIDKYHLAAHLKNMNSPIEMQQLQSQVASWISLEQSEFNSLNLVVETSDRYFSAEVANAIMTQVNKVSKELYARELINRIEILKRLITTVGSTDSSSDELLSSHFAIIQQQLMALSANHYSADQLKDILNELTLLQKQYDDRLMQLRVSELMLKQISNNGATSMTLIQRAVPDFASYVFRWVLYSVIIAIFVCSFLPLMLYFFFKFEEKRL